LEVIVPVWFLDSQFGIAVLLGVVVVALVVALLGQARVIGRKFARLQSDVERLSREVKQLQAAEERRFMKELRSLTKPGTAVTETPPMMASHLRE
jgi:hypothetical protein